MTYPLVSFSLIKLLSFIVKFLFEFDKFRYTLCAVEDSTAHYAARSEERSPAISNGKNLVKAGKVISLIVGSIYCLAAAYMAAYAIICFTNSPSDFAQSLMNALTQGNGCYGLNAHFLGMNSATAGTTYIICALLNALVALSFCNVFRCLKVAESSTPFQPKVQRMISQIGFFMIVSFIATNAGNFILIQLAHQGNFGVSVDAGLNTLVFGTLILCLSQIFKRGIELESEVEGLI